MIPYRCVDSGVGLSRQDGQGTAERALELREGGRRRETHLERAESDALNAPSAQ